MTSAYQQLTQTFQRLSRFGHLSAIAGWDMQTMMPPAGSQARGEALAELSVLQHQILTDSRMEALARCGAAGIPERRGTGQSAGDATRVATGGAAARLAGRGEVDCRSRCEHARRQQRPANDWQGFSANLKEVVRLSREEAEIRAQAAGCSRYDALLDLYEPGMTSAQLDATFGDLIQWLPTLLERVVEKQAAEPVDVPLGPFPIEAQRQLGLQLMKLLGFDFNAGRLDVSAHPFCGGVPEDVRITTRYNENEFVSAMMGVIHETGHARYEQNLPKARRGQPVALARSTAIHESQSLFFEMQLSRSAPFLQHILPLVTAQMGEQPALTSGNFVRLNQRVKRGFIRVDADEVSYPLHVILRYEIERALIGGDIEVEDIPALWDEKMQRYLGLDTRATTVTAVCRIYTGPTAPSATSRPIRWARCTRRSCSVRCAARCRSWINRSPLVNCSQFSTGFHRISGSTAAASRRRS